MHRSLVVLAVLAGVAVGGAQVKNPPLPDEPRPLYKKKWSRGTADKMAAVKPIVRFTPPGYIGPPSRGTLHSEVENLGLTFDGKKSNGIGKLPPVIDELESPQAATIAQAFLSINQTIWEPPDPNGAVANNRVLSVANDRFRIQDKLGNTIFEDSFANWRNITGDEDGFYFDPQAAYDPWGNRWIMLWLYKDSSTQTAEMVLCVSQSSTIDSNKSGWWVYGFNADIGGLGGTDWTDYLNLGYGPDGIYGGGNQFSFGDSFRSACLRTWNKAEVYNGAGAVMRTDFNLTNPDGTTTTSPRASHVQSGVGADHVWVNARGGGGDKITLWKVTDPFGAHTLTKVDIDVSPYDVPPNMQEPDGSRMWTIDCRLFNSVVVSIPGGGTRLYTGNNDAVNAGTKSGIHRYVINPTANTLVDEEVRSLSGGDYAFPSVAADYSGCAVWVFSACTSSGTFVGSRFNAWEGAWGGTSTLYAGAGNYSGGRWGDYFGGTPDWRDYGGSGTKQKLWLFSQHALANSDWQMHTGAIACGAPAPDISVTSGGFTMTGYEGGPFVPNANYTISNTSSDYTVDYEITSLPTWLTLTGNANQISKGGSDVVTFSPNASTNALTFGVYSDSIRFESYLDSLATRTGTVRVSKHLTVDSVSIERGSLVSGAVSNMDISDNLYYVVRNGPIFSNSESPITMRFNLTGPASAVGAMRYVFESKCSIGNLRVRVALLNITTGNSDEIDSFVNGVSDATRTFNVPNPNNYIRSGSRAIVARVLVKENGPVSSSTWRLSTDLFNLDIDP